MKMVKSLILGSAAGLLAMSGAQAADLPVKAKPVECVRICSLYGAGFFYIPGPDACIKIGGYLRAEVNIHGGVSGQPFWSGDGAFQDRYANQYNDMARMALTINTRTATEYGVVRTFGQIDETFATEGVGNSIGVQSSLNPTALQGGALTNFPGAGYSALEFAFVQFAGFTFGKSASAFNTPWHGYPGNNTSFLVGGYDTVTGINNIQYSWPFGNGVSATIGVDENSASQFNRTQIINGIGGGAFLGATTRLGTPPGTPGGAIGFSGACSAFYTPVGCAAGGTVAPDFVGNIRVDQAWGLFQISGVAHDNHAGYFEGSNLISSAVTPGGFSQTGFINFGHPADKWGGAVSVALQIKNIPTGAGDDIKMDATFAQGASKYTFGTSSAAPSSLDIYNGTKFAMGAG